MSRRNKNRKPGDIIPPQGGSSTSPPKNGLIELPVVASEWPKFDAMKQMAEELGRTFDVAEAAGPIEDERTCADCAHFVEVEPAPERYFASHAEYVPAKGQCRRSPPSIGVKSVTQHGPMPYFPIVPSDIWCGEFKSA